MLELIPVHNLYWKKYLTFGYHELITLWMDDYGLPIYRCSINYTPRYGFSKQGVTILVLIKTRYVMLTKQNINQYLKNV